MRCCVLYMTRDVTSVPLRHRRSDTMGLDKIKSSENLKCDLREATTRSNAAQRAFNLIVAGISRLPQPDEVRLLTIACQELSAARAEMMQAQDRLRWWP